MALVSPRARSGATGFIFVILFGATPDYGRVAAGPLAAVSADSSAASLTPPAGPGDFRPNFEPTLNIRRATGPIRIDGRLDEAAWQRAARAGNFCQIEPRVAARPPVGTEVLVAYDDSRIYFGFRAYDDPGAVRAQGRDRDAIQNDDRVGILLDPHGDGSWAYEIFINPLGTPADSRWNAKVPDARFDLAFESKGRITTDGYQVEVAIPFASLHLPSNDLQSWRATFLRLQPRDRARQYSWAAIDRSPTCFSCGFGTLAGIRGVRRGSHFNVLDPIPDIELGWLPPTLRQ